MTKLSKTAIFNLDKLRTPSSDYRGTMAGMSKLIAAGLIERAVNERGTYTYATTEAGIARLT